ncbi:CU044_5270 family protein [Nonomuraea sp. SMC257]|uniref:CU044_5270 family protein n=1 Tax=Nonomuraea montanisoli TaxID=2741721 RepID=A0A7Y6I833_9ACTN|nr:CU044_5270 family protein [Nonomuraea montanisoli]NUW33450.1 CU044_5270 family protein [Nonomuraea montanisoli]
MNELDMVRDLRSQVRQTEERDLHAARRRVLASMAPQPRGSRFPRLALRAAAVGALGAALVAGVVVVQNHRTDGPGKGTAAPAWMPVANVETVAKRATAAAARQPDVYPRADQWIYTKREFYGNPAVVQADGRKTRSRYTEEAWSRGDGKERALRDEGDDRITRRKDGVNPRLRFDPDYLRSLPLEPSALLERLKKDAVDATSLPEARAVSHLALTILQEGAPPARLRAALYTVMSKLDDVGVERVRDLVGREGWAIYTDEGEGIRREIIIDPDTFALLGGRRIYLGTPNPPSAYKNLSAGDVVFSVAQVADGIVDHPGDVP